MAGKLNYNVSSNNRHLDDVYSNYDYLDIGSIGIDSVNRFLNGEILSFDDIIDRNMLASGIGKITSANREELFQLTLLKYLSEENKSNVICVTYGLCCYKDLNGIEKFAPICLFPVFINFNDKKLKSMGFSIENRGLLYQLTKLNIKNETSLRKAFASFNGSFESAFDLDKAIIDFSKDTGLIVSLNSFLTIAALSYDDFISQEQLIKHSSITEFSEKELYNKFYNDIHFVTPLNYNQKYALIKVHEGESIVVSGAYGTGKTRTALNICSDAIMNGKRVLYVNNSLHNIRKFKTDLYTYGMGYCTYDIVNSIKFDGFKKHVTTSDVKPVTDSIEKLEKLQSEYNSTIYGYPYSYIVEKIAMFKAMNLKGNIILEHELDRSENEQVSSALEAILHNLKHIKSYKNHIWNGLNSNHTDDSLAESLEYIVTTTNDFYDLNNNLIKKINKFVTNYGFNKIERSSVLTHLLLSLDSLRHVTITEKWFDNNFFIKAFDLQKLIDNSKREVTIISEEIKELLRSYDDLIKLGTNVKLLYSLNQGKQVDYDKLFDDVDTCLDIYNNLDEYLQSYKELMQYFINLSHGSDSKSFLTKFYERFIKFFMEFNIKFDWLNNTNFNAQAIKSFKDNYKEFSLLKKAIGDITHKSDITLEEISNLTTIKEFKLYLKEHSLSYDRKTINNAYKNIVRMYNTGKLLGEACGDTELTTTDESIKNFNTLINFFDNYKTEEKTVFKGMINHLTASVPVIKNEFYKKVVELSKYINSIEKVYGLLKSINFFTTYDGSNYYNNIQKNKSNITLMFNAVNSIITAFKDFNQVSYNNIVLLEHVYDRHVANVTFFNSKSNLFKEYFGSLYDGMTTNTRTVSQYINYFKYAYAVSNNHEILKRICLKKSDLEYNNILDDLLKSHEKWIISYRSFAAQFYNKLGFIQSYTLSDIKKRMKQYVQKFDDVKYIYNIDKALSIIESHDLQFLIKLIKEEEFDQNLVNEFKYSTFMMLYNNYIVGHNFTLDNFVNTMNEINEYEKLKSDNNILELSNMIDLTSKRNKKKSTYFDGFSVLDNVDMIFDRHINFGIFLADTFTFNIFKSLKYFDMVIIDDAGCERAMVYSPLVLAKQIIILGDSTYRTSVSNGLMQRLKKVRPITFNKSYAKLSGIYIHHFDQTLPFFDETYTIRRFKSFNEYIVSCVNDYIKNRQSMRIFVPTQELLFKGYQILINNLAISLNSEELNKALESDIVIKRTDLNVDEFKDKTYLWINNSIKNDLANRLHYLVTFAKQKNTIICCDSLEIVKSLTELSFNHRKNNGVKSISTLLYNDLKNKGIIVKEGYGLIDLFILKNNTTYGIIIYGKRVISRFDILDDYNFYNNFYKENGINIIEYTCEDFIKDYKSILNSLIKL